MDFDSVTVRNSGRSVLMTAEEFMELPASDRAGLVAANQIEFMKEGKVITNKEALERAKVVGKSSYLAVLNGSNKPSTRIQLNLTTTSLTKAGKQLGSIILTSAGYVLKRLGGAADLLLNGKVVPADGVVLQPGDTIDITGTRLRFFG